MSKSSRPLRRRAKAPAPKVDVGAALADFYRRRLTGQPLPPRGHYGPVDEALVAELKRRLERVR